jgi:hypothetical protein
LRIIPHLATFQRNLIEAKQDQPDMTFDMTTNRRALLQTLAAGGAWAALPSASFAQAAGDVPMAQLMQPSPLPDLWVGSKDAPVTMIEYASMTCPHCAAGSQRSWRAETREWVHRNTPVDRPRIWMTICHNPPPAPDGGVVRKLQGVHAA